MSEVRRLRSDARRPSSYLGNLNLTPNSNRPPVTRPPLSGKECKKLSLGGMTAGYYERGDSSAFAPAARKLLI
jgi:hypothetical protein